MSGFYSCSVFNPMIGDGKYFIFKPKKGVSNDQLDHLLLYKRKNFGITLKMVHLYQFQTLSIYTPIDVQFQKMNMDCLLNKS